MQSGLTKKIATRLLPGFEYVKKPRYATTALDYDDYWRRLEAKTHLKQRHLLLARQIPDSSRVLEVGCGTGDFSCYLMRKKNCEVLATDISERAVCVARRKGVNAMVRDIAREPLGNGDGRFDFAVLSEVVEHCVGAEELLNSASRCADILLVSVPNAAYVLNRLCLMFAGRFPAQWVCHPAEHVRFWSVTDFRRWTRHLGFEILWERAATGVPIFKNIMPNLFAQQTCFTLRKK